LTEIISQVEYEVNRHMAMAKCAGGNSILADWHKKAAEMLACAIPLLQQLEVQKERQPRR